MGWSDWIGVFGTVAGLVLAGWQWWQRRTDRTAYLTATQRSAATLISVLAHSLHRSEHALATALAADDHLLARYALDEWRAATSEVLSPFVTVGFDDADVTTLISTSNTHAVLVTTDLAARPTESVRLLALLAHDHILKAHTAIAQASATITQNQLQQP